MSGRDREPVFGWFLIVTVLATFGAYAVEQEFETAGLKYTVLVSLVATAIFACTSIYRDRIAK